MKQFILRILGKAFDLQFWGLYRIRRKKPNFSYEAQAEPTKDHEEKYKILFYFMIDQALSALHARFEQLSHHSNYFQLLLIYTN